MSATETTTKNGNGKETPAKRIKAVEMFVAQHSLKSETGEELPEAALMAHTDKQRAELEEARRTIAEQTSALTALRKQKEDEDDEALADLPVDTYKEAAPFLRRPFTAQAVKFKVQATWPRDGDKTGGLIVAYIDARLAIERLNLVCPHLWADAYEQASGGMMWCHLTIDSVTRRDVGEGVGKGLVSDALKRAAVHFGVGVSLYAIPQMRFNVSDGFLKPIRTKQGPSLELTPNGLTRCQDIYQAWLDTKGIQSFGVPLDHGDADDAAGDVEVEREAEEHAAPPPAQASNGTGQRTQAPQQAAAATEPPPEEQLAELLAQDDELAEKRREAAQGMEALGATPKKQLVTLLAATSERALDELLVRVQNAADAGAK